MKLFGQDELAQLGGLQAVHRAVVADGDRLVALQQHAAVQRGRGALRAGGRCLARYRGARRVGRRSAAERGGGQGGLHGGFLGHCSAFC